MNRANLWASVRIAVLCTWCLGYPHLASAAESLRNDLADAATTIKKFLDKSGISSIAVGDFTGPAARNTAFGPGIRKVLGEELARLGLMVKQDGATVGVKGRFRPESEPFEGTRLRIEFELEDANGAPLTAFNDRVTIDHSTAQNSGLKRDVKVEDGKFSLVATGSKDDPASAGLISRAIGGTADFQKNIGPPNGDTAINAADRPTAFATPDGVVKPSRTSPLGLQVLVGGQPRAVNFDAGQPYVALHKDETFQLRMIGSPRHETALTVELDGVNSFAFSELRYDTQDFRQGTPRFSRWILPPSQPLLLMGWHRTNSEVSKFKMTDRFEESAPGLMGLSASQTGMITATFHATWVRGQREPRSLFASPPPPRQPRNGNAPEFMSKVTSTSEVFVGFGDRDFQHVTPDGKIREFSPPLGVITVRYKRPVD
jgi:hypothetical protein